MLNGSPFFGKCGTCARVSMQVQPRHFFSGNTVRRGADLERPEATACPEAKATRCGSTRNLVASSCSATSRQAQTFVRWFSLRVSSAVVPVERPLSLSRLIVSPLSRPQSQCTSPFALFPQKFFYEYPCHVTLVRKAPTYIQRFHHHCTDDRQFRRVLRFVVVGQGQLCVVFCRRTRWLLSSLSIQRRRPLPKHGWRRRL